MAGSKVPILIMVGERDTSFIQAVAYMNAAIPGSRKVAIHDAGHMVNMDQPQPFNSVVTNFLGTISIPAR